ncbi:MAG: alpha/beta hydrolase [Anaerolineae bacterium]
MLRRMLLVVIGMMMFVLPVHAQDGMTYVLVHGAFQDAAGWDPVIAELEAAGHTAIAVQLPGRGDDTTPMGEQSLAAYRDAVITVIEEQDTPVVLVAHSFGGMVISEVAEAIPDQIATLVYVAAYLPQNGDSLVTLSENDHFSQLGQEGNFIVSADFTTASVNRDIFASAFCPDCDAAQAEAVAASQLDEPLPPLGTPVTLTDENFGSVRRVYILTAQDIVVSAQLQAFMLSNTPVDRVFALNTGHVPYVTAPAALAALLVQAVAE